LLFRDDQTLADMHYALQIVFNWTDEFLHRFLIRGCTYTVPRVWGADYTQAAQDVALQSLRLRSKERFVYEYNFFDCWQVEIRLEKQRCFDEAKNYPVCIGGKRAGPLEDCGGSEAYLTLREEKYHPIRLLNRFQEIAQEAEDDADCGEWIREEFPNLAYWLTADKFDRRQANRRFKQYAAGDEEWQQGP
jgi:hypothetical protein